MLQQYKQTIIRCICLLLAGAALQFLAGPADATLLAYPWGVIAAVNYLYLLIILSSNREKWQWVQSLYNRREYISSIAAMLLLTLLFGTIRQDGAPDGLFGLLGFTQMKTSWIFILFLFNLMTMLGLRAIEEVRLFRKSRLPITIVHLSFFLILVAAVFGSGDKMRVTVTAVQGEPTDRAVTKDGKVLHLPFTLRLKEFSMDEYPPHIYIYSGGTLTKDYVAIDAETRKGCIGAWQIECIEYIDSAGRMPGDSLYRPMKHVGATTAAYIKATDGTRSVEGWVSCGSHVFPASTIALPDSAMLVMPQREAKKYLSRVEIETEGEKSDYEISVNHPATVGSWKIYQSAYDRTRGKWSTITVLECVKDGWYPIVETAMWIAMAVGVVIFIFGSRLKRKEDEK